jgi:translation initiation factor 3 subunit C
MIQRQQNVSEPVPPFYVKTLIELETSVNAALAKEKEAKQRTNPNLKALNALNAKALTAMKQKLKKAIKEYESDITSYKADPEEFVRLYDALVSKDAAPAPVVKTPGTRGPDEEADDFIPVGKSGKVMQLSVEGIFKNLQTVQEARGKKVLLGTQFHLLLMF